MAYVAVNKDGSEIISTNKPVRVPSNLDMVYKGQGNWTFKNSVSEWADYYDDSDEGEQPIEVDLPRGSIKKLIGRELTWLDEPVDLDSLPPQKPQQ